MKTREMDGETLALKNVLAGEAAARRVLEKLLRASSARLDVTGRSRLEQALSHPASNFAAIFEHSWDAVFFFDDEGRILEANPQAERLLGYAREELRGLKLQSLIPPRDLEEAPVRYEELRGGGVVRGQRRLRRKDGSLVEVEAIGSAVGGGVMLSFVREREGAGAARDGDFATSAVQLGRALGEGSVGAGLGFLRELSVALAAAAELLGQSHGDDAADGVDVSRGVEFYEEVSRFETGLIRRALGQTGGNQKRAAALLGMRHNTLSAMIHRHGIDPREFKIK